MTALQQALIFVGGVLLIAAIAVAILRDAHRRAPLRPGESPEPAAHHNRTAGQRRRDRARSRAARRARRRNR